MFHNSTQKPFTLFRACLDWLGNLRAENESLNDDISSDALRIASLEAANADLKAQTRAANIKAMVWQVKAEDLQDKLDNLDARYENTVDTLSHLQCRLTAAQPLIDYAKRRKDSLARYELRRGK